MKIYVKVIIEFFMCLDRSVPTAQDVPNEVGSQSSLTRGDVGGDLSNHADSYYDVDHHWEMNYHEAAIFLEVR